ncbi:cold shock and DUF1294 domain-containing protein [Rhodanobacter sp. AS-Z3]|uniref:cold shock and DUF1294 domain-containing protein n=1 Tax=Rhodanobacter sp. AS-Z3 TaxID=3031330 RepID=UPI00247B212E|nr:cold shock and DUF1294 domain-containing protein [Rhodanobacter sp. AS-Z3]WEN16646.1 cold shock and DUF1294 domain-containing protein [Rhodanobacter sp. AS-Z3]
MREQGWLVEWDDARGFGFVVTHGGDQRVFVHVRQFAPGRARRPRQGDILVYEVKRGERGRLIADAVRFSSAAKRQARDTRRAHWGLAETVALLWGMGLIAMLLTDKIPWQVAAGYPLLSVVAWLVYQKDKRAAGSGRWRTPESTLQLLALLGGWPGAWLAQKYLRHKSSKTSFQITFWFMVALNLMGLFWLVPRLLAV